ncbi:MAG: hypothetical protein H7836_11385 [Magnetococcus sp. YQC-3]
MAKLRSILKDEVGAAKTIIMFLVVILIFTGVFGTIALQLDTLSVNADVAAIPGGVVMLSIVGLLGIVMIVMWAIKKAFIVDWNGHTMRNLRKNDKGAAKSIIMFLVVVLIFTGIFGTIAMELNDLGENANVASIPGGTVMISIVGLLGIIIIVMWAIKKAF